ncbi:hypothetical protein JW872_00665 [Candidatus Babeliales bacterium]|nr:hypothetical protein [Candidatus Babeliales bacterium]
MKSQGIVLKNYYPKRYVIRVLDQDRGVLEVLLEDHRAFRRVFHGALLQYVFDENRRNIRIGSVNIIDIPFSWARQDIAFLHHLIELVYYGVLCGVVMRGVYDLFLALYQEQHHPFTDFLKKSIIARFFIVIGVHPEGMLEAQIFNLLEHEPIDVSGSTGIDLKAMHSLDRFLAQCLEMHPEASKLKTTRAVRHIYGDFL